MVVVMLGLGPVEGAADGKTKGFLGVLAGAVFAVVAVAVLKRKRLVSVVVEALCTPEVFFSDPFDRTPSALLLLPAIFLIMRPALSFAGAVTRPRFRRAK